MFSPIKLELKPSIRVAIFFSIPCLATLVLILTADIPPLFTFLFVCIHLLLSYKIISKLALLSLPSSIQSVRVDKKAIYLEDKSGQLYIAKPVGKNIIHPTFSLLSFDCIESTTSTPKIIEEECDLALQQKSTTETINGNIIDQNSNLFIDKLLSFKQYSIDRVFLFKNRRHLFICRYNTDNSRAFRQVRVWLKFNQ